jgi:Outer membrane protein beta-barrel domain
MKKLLFLIALSLSIGANAQYQWDYGIKLGAANYLGDIGGKDQERQDFIWDMHLAQTRYAVGAYGRYKLSKRLAIAANFDHLLIQDADMYTTYVPRRARNLNFRNRMFEFGARAELTVWYDNDVGNRGYYNPDYKLYVFGGLSAYYSNPQGRLVYDGLDTLIADLQPGDYQDNVWYNLRDYQTEGKSYSQFGVAIPVGLGMYFTFNKEWRVGWEINWRTTFSDYLDDVSSVYTAPTPVDPENIDLAYDLQSQTYPELISELNGVRPDGVGTIHINDFQHQPGNDEFNQSIRGYNTNNDSYITSQITVGKVVRGRSKFYKSKYSWVKTRATVKRSRAKF